MLSIFSSDHIRNLSRYLCVCYSVLHFVTMESSVSYILWAGNIILWLLIEYIARIPMLTFFNLTMAFIYNNHLLGSLYDTWFTITTYYFLLFNHNYMFLSHHDFCFTITTLFSFVFGLSHPVVDCPSHYHHCICVGFMLHFLHK